MYLSFPRLFLTILILIIGLLLAIPNIIPIKLRSQLPYWWSNKTINLGLDLQGGSQILLEVDTFSGIKDHLNTFLDEVRCLLKKERIGYFKLKVQEKNISFYLRNIKDKFRVKELLSTFKNTNFVFEDNNQMVNLEYSKVFINEKKNCIISRSIEIIEHRINELGTKEPSIQRQGNDRILVQLPGVKNPNVIKGLLGKTAKMTFHIVRDLSEKNIDLSRTISLPLKENSQNKTSDNLLIDRNSILTGDYLEDARVTTDKNFCPQVNFSFDTLGSTLFAKITRENIGHRLAVVLDGEIIVAPVINSIISGGVGVIQGNFTIQEASNLSILMRSGSLPAPLKILEERIVGPELGLDSIQYGKNATIIAIICIFVFMIFNYNVLGMLANLALSINIILLIGVLSFFEATLTLAGVAGIALTVGMSVDANILIYERIKEELSMSGDIYQSIKSGYTKAIITIIDSNLTTLIGALLLFKFGSGSIRGFAVTLSIGILISMFTAISLTRIFVLVWINFFGSKKLLI